MPKNTFIEFAEAKQPFIDKHIQLLFKQQRAEARAQNDLYFDLIKQLGKLIGRGGKRMRPLLCLLAYESYGGRKQAITRVAASQELLHAFFLIHDDIIDRDYHRWGGQNILGVYFERYSQIMEPRDALHAAEAQALLAGDVCAAMANEALLTSGFPAQLLVRAQRLQQQTIATEVGGEVADTALPYNQSMPTEAEILRVYRDKTASYSLKLPLQLGALLAGADQTELQYLQQFANHHGIAFQLQDDLLSMFGNAQKVGKPIGTDLREGTRTVLVLRTLEKASPATRVQFLKLLGSDTVDEHKLVQARTIMIECGARDYVSDLAQQYSEKSLEFLVKTSMSGAGKKKLIDLIALLAHRDH
jgi:geranylgeranyl pyrophosphate synthase